MNQMFQIDTNDPMPLYAQLELAIRGAVAVGRVRPGDQLPTVRQLAVELKINANTVAKVYAELERSGIVETRRGVGTFVTGVTGIESARDRERELKMVVDRFLASASDLGYSLEEIIEHLQQRRR